MHPQAGRDPGACDGMRVRIAPDLSCVGYRYLGALVAAFGLVAFLVWHGPLWGLALAAIGLSACRSRSLFILHPQHTVLAQIEKTLGLLTLKCSRRDGQIVIPVTRTTARTRALGPVTHLSFILGDPRSPTEIYLMNTLVKYLKYQRYRTGIEAPQEG